MYPKPFFQHVSHVSLVSRGVLVPASSGGGASSRLKLGDYQVKSCFLGDQFSKVEINAHPKYVLQWPTHYLGGLMHYYMEVTSLQCVHWHSFSHVASS